MIRSRTSGAGGGAGAAGATGAASVDDKRSHERVAPSAAAAPSHKPDALALRLGAALECIDEAILVVDRDGRAVFQNDAARTLLTGRPADALVAQAVSDLIRDALAGLRPKRQLDLTSPSRRNLSIRSFPIGDQAVDGAVVVVEDISERLRLEAVRRDFVANVSHELKTPTGALTLLAETLDGESDPDVVVRLARRMGGEAERLSRIIDDLLSLSRIEANESPGGALVLVGDFVNEAVSRLSAAASQLDIDIKVAPLPTGHAVSGDRWDLVSAVQNLVDNAVKYSDPGATVTVTVTTGLSEVSISVADEGVGIPARDLERIFERFYRVDRARSRSTGGTGLGLSIVRHVAANHGGRVRVRSSEGEGSVFTLELPAVVVPDAGLWEGASEVDDRD